MSEQDHSSDQSHHSSDHSHHSSSHRHHRKKRLKIPRNALIIALAAVVFIGLFVLLVRYLDQQDAEELQVYAEADGTGSVRGAIAAAAPYDPNVMDAWQNSLTQMKAKADIVFIGDSLIRMGRFDEYFPDKTVANLGLNGDTLVGMANRANMIKALSPGKVFVMGGINSLKRTRFEETVKEYGVLLSRLSAACAGEVYILSLLPVAAEVIADNDGDPADFPAFNDRIRSMAEEYGFTYIDLYSLFATEEGTIRQELTEDGVHLTEEGYRVFADAVRLYID